MADTENTKSSEKEKTGVRAASFVAAIAAFATIIASFIGVFVKNESQNVISNLVDERVYTEIADMRSKILRELDSINDLRTQIQAISKLPPNTRPSPDYAKITAKLASIESRLKTLEDGLGDNPGKALSTPLLRKDIEALQKSSRDSFAVTQKEIERIYDQNKWFIGLIATMAVGVLGLAVGNLAQGKK
jgi:hypothetical protein